MTMANPYTPTELLTLEIEQLLESRVGTIRLEIAPLLADFVANKVREENNRCLEICSYWLDASNESPDDYSTRKFDEGFDNACKTIKADISEGKVRTSQPLELKPTNVQEKPTEEIEQDEPPAIYDYSVHFKNGKKVTISATEVLDDIYGNCTNTYYLIFKYQDVVTAMFVRSEIIGWNRQ